MLLLINISQQQILGIDIHIAHACMLIYFHYSKNVVMPALKQLAVHDHNNAVQ